MGAELRVIAFGPFDKKITHFLEYPYGWYDSVPDGKKVVTCVVKTITRSSSEEVAECFGAKLFDFGTHWECVPDMEKLKQAVEERVIDKRELEAVRMLHDAGFKFMLLVDA